MTKKIQDHNYIEKTLHGDNQAFDELVLKYQHRLVKLVGRYVRDPNEVFDIVQDTFIKAYRALSHFRGESAFYTWLYRIAINTAKNHAMEKGRRPPDHDIDITDAEAIITNRPNLKEYNSPERMLICDEIEARVIDAMDHLPEDLRTTIILREMEGFSYEDISEVMHCPIGTVRSRIFRAREAIDNQVNPLMQQCRDDFLL